MKTQRAPIQDRALEAESLVREILLSPEGRMDPYPRYRRLREIAPVHRSDLGMWILTRYDDCASALGNPQLDKDYARQNDSRIGPHWRDHVSLTDGARSMVNVDGPTHTRLRRLVNTAFTRATIEALRPNISARVDHLLDEVAQFKVANLLDVVGFPLALGVIGEMLGVPEGDLAQFPQLVRDILVVFETRPSPDQLATADKAQVAFRDYFQQLVTAKRQTPGRDLLSALIDAREDGDFLTTAEICDLATLLFGAGFETTANQIGSGALALLMHQQELARLRDNDALFSSLPDELLRYDGTAQMTVRVTTVPIVIGGIAIPAGETLLVLLGAGNRDPDRFAEPERLDVMRTNIRPLTLGGGVHYCLGAALARVELEILFRKFFGRFRRVELAGTPRFRDRITLRGLEALEVTCS